MKRLLVLMIALAAAAVACGGDDTGSTAPAGGGEERVEMADFAFSPATLTVAVGTTVTWENTDPSLPHTSTSEDEVWDSGTVNAGEDFSFTFDEAGTFAYFCEIHPSMTGNIVVEG